ncbi:MAG: phosphate ABC transporter permease PstA [Firmicutes bacterium]|jgi:phosphate transport system permease protein|nr:phosphate ABC transporter permease PstA [Bacillota bacterium]
MTAHQRQKAAFCLLWLAAGVTVGVLVVILAYILLQGMPHVSWEFLTAESAKMGQEGGIFSAIVGTFYFVLLSLIVAMPLGIGAAIYLVEYSDNENLNSVINFGIDALAAVPSIVFGLFGFAFFVIFLKPITGGWSILSGSFTAACMVLPTLIRTTQEALRAVPTSYREASLALGATRGQTVRWVVVPTAIPGILTGIILSLGRVVGETAALLLTLGGSLGIPHSIFEPARTLSIHLYLVAMEVGAMDKAFATAAVLIILVFIINLSAGWIARRVLR